MTVDELVAQSCEYHGVPLTVEDPEALATVAAIVRTQNEPGTQGQPGSSDSRPPASQRKEGAGLSVRL